MSQNFPFLKINLREVKGKYLKDGNGWQKVDNNNVSNFSYIFYSE